MYVYILLCNNGNYYTGIAKDLQKRMKNHGQGSKYTKANKPVALVYVEKPANAYKREAEIKKLTRKQKEQLFTLPNNIVNEYNIMIS